MGLNLCHFDGNRWGQGISWAGSQNTWKFITPARLYQGVHILLSVLTGPDLQQELLSHLHAVRNRRFKFQREQEPSVTLRAEPELLIHQGKSGQIRAGHRGMGKYGSCHMHTRSI